MIYFFRALLPFFLICVVTIMYEPSKAYANCTNPSASLGTIRYNNDYDVFQGCTNSNWIGFHDYKTTIAPKGCVNPGDVCDDGSVYAGFGPTYGAPNYEQTYFFVTFRDAPRTTFNNGSGAWTVVTSLCSSGLESSCFTGTENTKALALANDAASPHRAARYCYNLTRHGRNDWYLPSFQEHRFVIYPNRAAIPNLSTSGISLYTSSSENTNRYYISKRYELEDNQGWLGEKNTYHGSRITRCVRRLGCFKPSAPTGTLAYNEAEDAFQGCTISGWVKIHEDASGAGCSNPSANPGEYVYNESEDVFQGCTAKGWVSFHRS